MRAIFLADAHLCRPSDQNYQAMLTFLDEQCGKTDLLVLLGDIFEFWIGKATVVDDYVPLIEALERVHHSGARLVYVEGNHDFHLGPVFTRRLNCQVFPDGGSIDIEGNKVYLAHGDLANVEETGYRTLRRLLRSTLVRTLIRILPSKLLMKIATRAGDESKKRSRQGSYHWSARDILKPYAQGLLALGNQVVITGHYHQPFHEQLDGGEHIAMGDWITQYSYAVYENQRFSLQRYQATSPAAESTS